jgi:hypothetical protein
MKPLNRRTPVTEDLGKFLRKTSEEKLIPEDQWQSLKKAAKEKQESK